VPAPAARRRYRAPGPAELRDSVDGILADWAEQRPDLDFSPVAVISRLDRIRSYLDAGVLEVFGRYGLSAADFRVIAALRRTGPPHRLPQARLASRLGLTSGTISVRIDRLAGRGLVTREADPGDRRGQLVRLSGEGHALFDEITPVHLANEDRLLSALAPAERDLLADLLRRLLHSFESGAVEVGLPLGMRLEPAHVARARRVAVGLSDTPGLLVAGVVAGTPAADAGLTRGDLLVAVNGAQVCSHALLADRLAGTRPGARLRLSILRGDEPMQVAVRAPGPARGGRGRRPR